MANNMTGGPAQQMEHYVCQSCCAEFLLDPNLSGRRDDGAALCPICGDRVEMNAPARVRFELTDEPRYT